MSMSTVVRVRRGEGGEWIYAISLLWLLDFTFDGSRLERLAELSHRAKGCFLLCVTSMPTLSQNSLVLAFLGLNSHSSPSKQLPSVSLFLALSV